MLYPLIALALLFAFALAMRQVGLHYYGQCFRLIAEKHRIALSEERLDRILGEAPSLYMVIVGVAFSVICFRRDWVALTLAHAAEHAHESVVARLLTDDPT